MGLLLNITTSLHILHLHPGYEYIKNNRRVVLMTNKGMMGMESYHIAIRQHKHLM